jgi:hypothetical protein
MITKKEFCEFIITKYCDSTGKFYKEIIANAEAIIKEQDSLLLKKAMAYLGYLKDFPYINRQLEQIDTSWLEWINEASGTMKTLTFNEIMSLLPE